jgi:diguanylate cyclase (GGDEF)-like protein/PAS domain S-box-containing protein
VGGNALDPIYRRIARTLADNGFLLEYYQRAAVLRRVHRRMQALSLPTLEDYAKFLESSATEVGELVREVSRPQGLLFRDATVIEVLASLLPDRLRNVRRPQIWVPACGTGEEVYATAMIIDALFGAAGLRKDFVIYGTDTDRDALRTAQSGLFHNAAAERVPAHLSEYHLGLVGGELHVISDLKQHCLFMVHDVAEPPPFFDVDLIVCRNLLHFLQAPLQRHLVEQFALALRARGLLFLGRMESPLEYPDLFRQPPVAPGLYERVDQVTIETTGEEAPGDFNRRRSDNVHAAIFRSIPIPLMMLDDRFAFIEANPAAFTVLGDRAAEMMGHELTEWVQEADHYRLQDALDALARERNIHVDLTLRDGRAVGLVLNRVPGHPGRVLIQAQIEGDERLRARLADTARHLDVLLRNVADAVIFVDTAALITEFNEPAQRLTGLARHEALDQPLHKILRFATFTPGLAGVPLELDLGQSRALDEDVYLLHEAGRRTAVTLRVTPIPDAGGTAILIRDVSERALLREELTFRTSHDPVTGLLNRDEFEARARAAHADARFNSRPAVIACIDLIQFKGLQEALGGVACDELLRDLATELRARLCEADSLARLGNEQFGVLLPGLDLFAARIVVDTLLEGVRNFRFQWGGRGHTIGVSIGASLIDAEVPGVAQVLSDAEAASAAARDTGINQAVYAGGGEELPQRYVDMSRARQLGRALDEDQFQLFFEDVVDVADPDRVKYRELLTRVREEDGRVVAPGTLIQAAERFFMMPALDRWVLRTALRVISRLPDDQIIYSINLSGQSIADPDFAEMVFAELDASRVDPRRICFEIAEKTLVSRLMDAVRFVDRLAAIGCRFALDDFGVGTASFSYLKNVHVDYVKIDGSFVTSMAASRADRGMVEAITRVAKELSMVTIAEHVEDKELFEALRACGVEWAQGRAIGIARPLDDIARLVT